MVNRRSWRAAVSGALLVGAVVVVSTTSVGVAVAGGGTTVAGHVFNDINMNGTNDTETPVQGIGVKVFDNLGALVGSGTTDSSGNYDIDVTNANTADVRVEFTMVRPWVTSFVGPDSGGDVQFVSLPASNVDLGVQIPGEWCANNGADPDLAVTRMSPNGYLQGINGGFGGCNNGTVITMPWYTNQPFSLTEEARYGGTTSLLRHKNTGTTYGLAYDAASSTIWTSAFIRRHSGLGPKGIGGLYVTSPAGGVVASYDLAGAPWYLSLKDPGTDYSNAARGIDNTPAPPDQSGTYKHSRDAVAFSRTGKDGIGDIAIDARGSKLWLVNLYAKSVQRIGITGTANEPSLASTVDSYSLPQVGDPGALCSIAGSVARPFGLYLNPRNQRPWVGVVCTNEAAPIPQGNNNQNSAPAERAVIVELDPAGNSGAGSWSVVTDVNLDYPHRNESCGYSTFPLPEPAVDGAYWSCWNQTWHAWTDDFTGLYDRLRNNGLINPTDTTIDVAYVQPIVSGISELGDGSLVVALTDRLNIQMGEEDLVPIEPDAVHTATHERNRLDGDILLLCRTGSTYTQESQGGCTSSGSPYSRAYQAPLRPWAGAGANVEGAEFFADNIYDFNHDGRGTHTEMSNGAVAVWPQSGDPADQQVAFTAMDPTLNIFESGIRWNTADNGDAVSGKALTAGGPPYGFNKSANLGNLEVICDKAPVQLASRLWYDANQNGIQDPGELPIAGATAHLYDSSGTLVGTAITDANGNYSFDSTVTEDAAGNGDSAGGGLQPVKTYSIKFDKPDDFAEGGPLIGLGPTTLGSIAPNGANSTAADSNLTLDTYPTLAVPALLAGHNEQDLDAGVTDVVALTGTVWTDSNGNDVKDTFEPTMAGVLVELLDANGDPIPGRSLTTDSTGAYSFDGLLPGTYKVRYTSPRGLYHFSDPAQGNDPLLDSDVTGAAPTDTVGTTNPIVLSTTVGGAISSYTGTDLIARYVDDQVTAGIVPPKVGVGNYVWVDLNKNGVQDSGEPPGPGASLELRVADSSGRAKDADGVEVAPVTTDADGHYFFDNLVPGTYKIFVTLPAGYEGTAWTTYATGGDPLTDSNANTANGNFGVDNFWSHASTTFTISAFAAGDTPYNPADPQDTYDATMADTDPGTKAVLQNPSLDFGIRPAGVAVGDFVWLDNNGNGLQDSGEPGVRGVSVSLVDANGDPVKDIDGNTVAPTTTDSKGFYAFGGLAPGDYRVRFTVPAGVTFTTPGAGSDVAVDSDATPTLADPHVAESAVFTLTYAQTGNMVPNPNRSVRGGMIDPTIDAGIARPVVAVGDLIWVDLNQNGVQDADEPGVPGAVITLLDPYLDPATDADGNPVPPVTTDADGHYFIDNLTPGSYFVRVQLPAGYNGTPWTVYASGGSPLTDSTGFPYFGALFCGLPNWTYGDDFCKLVTQLIYPVNVSALPYGNVPFDPRDNQWDYDGTIVETDPLTKATLWNPTNDAGITPAGVAVGDTVWLDSNKNGVKDVGEPGLSGVKVELLDKDGKGVDDLAGNPVTSTTTDSNGHYAFGNLAPGDYKVRFTLPGGLVWTTKGAGSDPALDSNVTPTQADDQVGESDVFTLSYTETGNMVPNQNPSLRGGMIDPTIDAGVLPPIVGIGNFVWWDVNKNGIQDPGEPGVSGATVALTTQNEWEQATDADGVPVQPVTTDADGHYEFDNLLPGRYRVHVTLPSGWALTNWTTRYAGNDPLLDSNAFEGNNPYGGQDYWNGFTDPFTVSAWPLGRTAYDPNCSCPGDYDGTVAETDPSTKATLWNPTIDLGVERLGLAVGNLVWSDTNRNGVQDPGEPGQRGVTVELLDKDGNPALDLDGNAVAPTTTDADGHYAFANLAPGEYKVRFTIPTGLSWTTPLAGSDTTVDSDATPTQADPQVAESGVFSLSWYGASAGQVVNSDANIQAQFINPALDAGILPPIVGIGNFVWWDVNKNGIQDPGEPGIAGAVVQLFKQDSVTQATDADGNPVRAVRTDADGHYFFDNLLAGRYDIKVTLPWGWRLSYWSPQYQGDDPLLDSNAYEGFDPFNEGDGFWNGHPDVFSVSAWPVGSTAYDPNCSCMRNYDGTVLETDPSTKATLWNPTIDFGVQRMGLALGDFVWSDTNRNGFQDAGEGGVPNVTVELLDGDGNPVNDQDGNPVGSTTTDGYGRYVFTNLAPGAYKVRFTAPAGTQWTSPLEGADPRIDSNAIPTTADPQVAESRVFSLAWDGQATGEVVNTDSRLAAQYINPTLDAGLVGGAGTAALVVGVGDFVWLDLNKNGLQDPGEPGIPGTRVQLLNEYTNTIAKDADGNPVSAVYTDATGHYFIDNLLPGWYWIRFTLPWGDSNTPWSPMFQSNNPLLDSNVWTKADWSEAANYAEAFSVSDSAVGASGYLDDCSYPPYCNWYWDGTIADTDPTTKALFWNPTIDGGVEPGGLGVGDRVWVDTNGNGVQDAGEHGLANVTVSLVDGDGNPVNDLDGNPVDSTTTDGKGNYSFGNLGPGTYKVLFTLPDGMTWTTPLAGTDAKLDSDATPTADPTIAESSSFTLSWDIASTNEVINTNPNIAAQYIDPTLDAGVVGAEPVIVGAGDYVWLDLNRNGIQDAGEPGIPGVKVQLVDQNTGEPARDADGNVSAPVFTDSTGHYFIDNLLPGTYRVQFTPPWGLDHTTWTLRMVGSDIAVDSNVYHEAVPYGDPWYIGKSRRFTVSASLSSNGTAAEDDPSTKAVLWNPTIDGGIEPSALAVGDYVWNDTNGNGAQDPGERGVEGVKVDLLDSGGNPAVDAGGNPVPEQTTDSAGRYYFTNLAAGSYRVRFTLGPGMAWTGALQGSNTAVDSDAVPTGDPSIAESPLFSLSWDIPSTDEVMNTDPTIAALYIKPSIDAGVTQPIVGVGDYVWLDLNKDGVQDAGEPVIPNASVQLYADDGTTIAKDADGNPVKPVLTDATGHYFIDNLLPGWYRVQFTLPWGAGNSPWTQRFAGNDPALDSNVYPGTQPYGSDWYAGKTRRFHIAPSAVGDTPYDPSCLCRWDYDATVAETDPATKAVFWNPTIDGGVEPIGLAVGNFVWADTNENGVQDAGEPGVPGVSVDLLNSDGSPANDLDGQPVAAATSDANGHYVFTNLAPGSYKVRFTRLPGTRWTSDLQGSDRAVDSDATPTADPTVAESGTFTLAWDSLPTGEVANTDPNIAAQFINPSIDAGLVLRVAIGDRVWIDRNANGVQDVGEPALSGVKVELLDALGGAAKDAAGNTVASQTTNVNGNYLFDGLAPGDYRVRFTLPSGYRFTASGAGSDSTLDSDAVADPTDRGIGLSPVFTVHAGPAGNTVPETDLSVNAALVDPTVDAGVVPVVAVGDRVWVDLNQDGLQDVGEPALSGVKVELLDSLGNAATDADGNTVVSQTTGVDGKYLFDDLLPGDYRVRFTLPSGYRYTAAAVGADRTVDSNAVVDGVNPLLGLSPVFTVHPSLTGNTVSDTDATTKALLADPTIDAGAVPVVAIGDRVWVDSNEDGLQTSGEPGLAGVTVELLDSLGAPALDADGLAVASTTSDSSGAYLFDNLLPGDYRVRFTLPAGDRYTAAAVGADRTVDSNAVADGVNPLLGLSPVFTVHPSVTGQTVADTDVSTAALFVDPTIDAGVVVPAVAVGDRVWVDLNQDGLQNNSEPDLAGVKVELLDKDGNAVVDLSGSPVTSQTTGVDGKYFFDDLLPGDYRVRFTLPSGYRYTPAAAGSDRTVDSNAVADGVNPLLGLTTVFTLHPSATGQTVADTDPATGAIFVDPTIDAGAVPLVAVGDRVWVDLNQDGVQDVGEPALSGVKVELLDKDGNSAKDADGNTVASQTTGVDGKYFFDDLLPGDYRVRFTLPSGYRYTTASAGSDRAVDSNAVADGVNPLLGLTTVFTLHPSATGQTVADTDPATGAIFVDPTIDAGAVPLVAVGDRVWVDLNQDGLQSNSEPDLAGVKVELLDKDGNSAKDADGNTVASQTTGVDGKYFFDDLLPGDYRVRFTLPAGYRYTTASAGSDRAVDSNAVADGVNPLLGLTPVFTVAASVTGQTVADVDGSTGALFVNLSIDAGAVPLVAIGDRVWVDLNQDGLQNNSEPDLAGVKVELLDKDGNAVKDADGNTVASQTTGVDGKYFFDNLLPGDYRVRFTVPDGYRYTTAAAGVDRTLDSNAVVDALDPTVGLTPTFTVASSATGQTVADTDVLTAAILVDPTIDAGAVPLVAVGDFVWVDLDRDGIQDVGEPALSGVTVELLDASGNPAKDADGNTVASQTTGVDGKYFFDNLLPGDYRVRFTLPTGFRYSPTAAGADRAVDSNAVADGGNPLLGLTPVFTVYPDATGQTLADADPLTDALLADSTIDVGAVPLVAIGDTVWVDRDRDGIQDVGEPGLAGVTVELLDKDGNAVAAPSAPRRWWSLGPVLGLTDTTDANGNYFFDNLLPGDYRLRFTLPAGYRYATAAAGVDRTLDSNAVVDALDPTVGLTPTFTVASSATGQTVADTDVLTAAILVDPTIDAGAVPLVAVGNFVWLDLDRDGIQDVGEHGFAGVTVELLDSAGAAAKDAVGATVASATTDSTGAYFFDGLLPGDYKVRFTLPTGYTYSPAAAGIDRSVDSNAVADGVNPLLGLTPVFSIDASATGNTAADIDGATAALFVNPTIDAGVVAPPVGLASTVWLDANKNGVRDTREKPFAGVLVELLDGNGNPATDASGAPVPPQTTGPDGRYFFDNLLPGDFRLRFTLPDGWRFTTPTAGTDGSKDSNVIADPNHPETGLTGVFRIEAWSTGDTSTETDPNTGARLINLTVGAGAVPGPDLPETGSDSTPIGQLAALLGLLGVAAIGVSRRRKARMAS